MEAVRPDAVIFDVNGTLLDLRPLRDVFTAAGLAESALELWLARVLRDGVAVAATGTFAAFADVAQYHLRQLLPDRSVARAQEILATLQELPLHDDVAPALRRLHDGGVRITTLTNGTGEVAWNALQRASLTALVERVADVGEVMLWKPRREPYAQLVSSLGIDAERCALISVHPWDIHGATVAGLLGAWANRRGAEYPPFMNTPTVRGRSLVEVADRLLDLAP